MSRNQVRPRTMRDAFAVLFRHKKKMFLFGTVVLLATAAGVVFAPRKYESKAALFFRIGRQSVALDPTAATGPMISVNDSTDSEINSALEVIQSRNLADRVVDRIGIEAFSCEKPANESQPKWLADLRDRLHNLDPVTAREAAVNDVQSSLSIESPKRSRIISIKCKADSPQLAQKISAAVVEEFMNLHLKLNATDGSQKFFQDQTKLLEGELEAATNRLRDLKNDWNLASIEDARHVLSIRVQTIETERLLAEANVAAATGRAAALTEAITGTPERLSTDEVAGFDNVAADQMRQQLYSLELREMELSSKYTDTHPFVIAVREQLSNARKVVETLPPARTHRTTTVNPTRQHLDVDLAQELAATRAGKERLQSLDTAKTAALAEQQKLNEREVEIAQLNRKIDLLNASYHTYAEKLEQSRIDNAVNDERISNVNVAQAATLVETPVSPNKSIVIGLGLFVALFGSIGLALVCEYIDESIKTPDEVESCLDVPVLHSIPRVRSSRVLLN